MLTFSKSCKKIICISFFALTVTCIKAQEIQKTDKQKNYFEPRISFQYKFTDNFNLDKSGMNGHVSEISPGFTWVGNTARIKGFADYSLNALFDSQKNQHHRINNRLNGFAVVEAIEQIGYVDIYGSITTQPISAFGNPADENRFLENNAQTKNYKISPYIKGIFRNNINYEARYSFSNSSSDSQVYSKSTTKDIFFILEKNPEENTIVWSTLASNQTAKLASRRTVTTSTLKGAVGYLPGTQLIVSAVAGLESTDQLSLVRESHSIAGAGGKWRPSERTLFSANFEQRYFGGAHEILFQHQTARTVWRYKDSKGISNGFGSSTGESGAIFDLLTGFYMQIEPDPVRRAQRVLEEIERLGLSSDTEIFQEYLRSTSTLQRAQRLSLAMLGLRSTITFEVFKLKNSRLNESLISGDDFDLNNQIVQNGWNLIAAHRLTPLSTIFLNISDQKNKGSNVGLKNKKRALKLGFNTRLSKKTNANFQIQRSLFDGNMGFYDESSVTGTLTYRF